MEMSSPGSHERQSIRPLSPQGSKDTFAFDALPVEIRHEVFKHLRTCYLVDVCARVSQSWEKIVTDVVDQRIQRDRELQQIPPHILSELNSYVLTELETAPVQILKLFEKSTLKRNFNITPILVNGNGVGSPKGMMYKVWNIRPCDCSKLDVCIVESVYLMSALDLFVVQSVRELQFFHLSDLERLEADDRNDDIRKYQYDNDTWFEQGTGTGISIFRDQIVAEEKPRAILLLKVSACNHENRTLTLERLRRIFLPIWSKSLCLLEDRFYVLYSTGYVGMWDRQSDELSISPNVVGNLRSSHAILSHSSKMFRMGGMVLIKTASEDGTGWHVVDSEDHSMEVHLVRMKDLIIAGYLGEDSSWECTEVFHLELWFNCLIVHCQVRSRSVDAEYQNRLMIKRLARRLNLDDFKSHTSFTSLFSSEDAENSCNSIVLNGFVISPFLPRSLKPWMLDPNDNDNSAVPVADMIAVYWPSPTKTKKNRKLKVYRIRISNLNVSRSLSL